MRANALMDRQEACNEILVGVLLDLIRPLLFEDFIVAAPHRIAKIEHTGAILTSIECKLDSYLLGNELTNSFFQFR